MEIVITKNPQQTYSIAAAIVADHIRAGKRTMGLATGSSPIGLYQELIALHKKTGLSFADMTAFLLDEYLGIPPEHPQSYAHFIRAQFTSLVDFSDSRVFSPSSNPQLAATSPGEYEKLIDSYGPIAIQILGIGTNGHIGFNEPGSSFGSRTRIKTLTPQTRADNARFFDNKDEVPTHAITQGLATIAHSEHIMLLATGTKKADAVAAMIEGPISSWCPASSLQLHPHVTVVIDEKAAHKLQGKEWYIYEHDHKPQWQKY